MRQVRSSLQHRRRSDDHPQQQQTDTGPAAGDVEKNRCSPYSLVVTLAGSSNGVYRSSDCTVGVNP
jgi:hypothetical protein